MNRQNETGQSGEPINYCPQCNNSYNLAKKFCGKCGVPLVAGMYSPAGTSSTSEQYISPDRSIQEKPGQPSNPSSITASKTIAATVAVVLCLSISGYFGYNQFVARKGSESSKGSKGSGVSGVNLSSSESPASVSKGIISNVYDTASRGDIDAMLINYSDRVQYLSSGIVDKSFISRDSRAYRKRWKYVKFEMVGEPTISTASEANIINVENEQRFHVANSKKTITGTARDYWTLRKEGDRWRIVAFKQTVLSRNKN